MGVKVRDVLPLINGLCTIHYKDSIIDWGTYIDDSHPVMDAEIIEINVGDDGDVDVVTK